MANYLDKLFENDMKLTSSDIPKTVSEKILGVNSSKRRKQNKDISEMLQRLKRPQNRPIIQIIDPFSSRPIKGNMSSKRKNFFNNSIVPLKPAKQQEDKMLSFLRKNYNDCPKGQIRNIKTGRCVKNKSKSKKPCPTGKVRNPLTGRCINSQNAEKKQRGLQKIPEHIWLQQQKKILEQLRNKKK